MIDIDLEPASLVLFAAKQRNALGALAGRASARSESRPRVRRAGALSEISGKPTRQVSAEPISA